MMWLDDFHERGLEKNKDRKKGKSSAGGASECQAENAGLVASGPGEVRLRRREDCAEDPDDAADLARPTAEVDQDDTDHACHDGTIHQVLPRNRRGGPQGPTEDDVDDDRRRHGGILVLWDARRQPLDPVGREGQEKGQEPAQHQEQLVWLLRAELGHGSPSRLVALGHGFGPEGRADSIRVPTRPSAGENHVAAGRLKIIPRNDNVSAYERVATFFRPSLVAPWRP